MEFVLQQPGRSRTYFGHFSLLFFYFFLNKQSIILTAITDFQISVLKLKYKEPIYVSKLEYSLHEIYKLEEAGMPVYQTQFECCLPKKNIHIIR
jgi:hypothetical protein